MILSGIIKTFHLFISFSFLSAQSHKEDTKADETISNAVPRPNFDCGSPTCNYRVVECKLTTTDEICRHSAPPKIHQIQPISETKTQNRPTTVSVVIPDEGKG